MLTDPIANLITVIRNGVRAKKDFVVVPSSRILRDIANILHDEGFVSGLEEVRIEGASRPNMKKLKVFLKYNDEMKTITPLTKIERVSRPGRRVYVAADKIPAVRGGLGFLIMSTSKGLATDRFSRKNRLGGEVLIRVY
jgi:small subunit ribosomal protein S8